MSPRSGESRVDLQIFRHFWRFPWETPGSQAHAPHSLTHPGRPGHGQGEVALGAAHLGSTHRLLPLPLGGAVERHARLAHLHFVSACTPSTMRG